MLGIFLI